MEKEIMVQDIRMIVGGHFSPDALSPEVYNEVVQRVTDHAAEYLDTFDEMFLSVNFDAQAQSRLYLPSFLELTVRKEPERTRATAARLLKQYDAVMIVYDDARDRDEVFKQLPDETVRFLQRLDTKRLELKGLLK